MKVCVCIYSKVERSLLREEVACEEVRKCVEE